MSTSLHNRLNSLRRRLLTVGLGASMGWSMAIGIALLVLCMWVDLALELTPVLRILCTTVCGALTVVIIAKLAVAVWRHSRPTALATRLDRAAAAQGQILTGVDLMFSPMMASSSAGGTSALTAGLARIAINRAATLASTIPAPLAVPARPLLQPVIALSCLVLALAIIAVSFPRLASTEFARFVDPFGDHPPYSRIEIEVTPGNTKVVYGSSIDIRATPRGENVEGMELVLKSAGADAEEKLPMFPEPAGIWRATLTNVTTDGRYFVRAAGARSRRFEMTVVTVPRLEAVRFRITPPAYTNRPPLEGPLPQGGLMVLPGTTVQVWAKSNRPLSSGNILADKPQGVVGAPLSATAASFALQPVASGSNEVTGSLIIRSGGSLSLTVSDVNLQTSTDPFKTPITLLRDERPFVRILEPKPDSFATPETTLNIEMLAEDDYGISRLQLFRTLNESRARSTEIPVGKPNPTRLPASVPLPLSAYGLSPGDVVKLFARVEDNDPNGPKGSESPVVTVQIISQEQMQQMLLAREGLETFLSKYEQAARRMETANEQIDKLRKELEKADPKSEVAKQTKDKLRDMAEQMKQDSQELAGMAGEDLPFDLDHVLKKQLDDAAKALDKAAEDVKKLAGKPGLGAGAAAEGLADAQKGLGQKREQFKEEAADPLEHLAKLYPLIEDQARFIELWQRQKDLAERMDSLIDHREDDPAVKARMRDLQAEQEQVHRDLRDLLDDIENKAAELPADPKLDDLRKSASEFAKAVRESTASDEMASAESALAEFAGTRSAAAAHLAAETLEKFIAKCNSMGGQASACLKFQPKLASGLGNTVQQLLDASGLGAKPGSGMAGMGGYSAQRSSLRNVGLYGHIPSRGKESRAQGGHAQQGVSADGSGKSVPGDPADKNNSAQLNASGQSQAAIPDRYKRRVGEYFQRVSDELDQNQK